MTPQSTGYALLAKDSYRHPDENDTIDIDGQTYTVFASKDNPVTGFQATAYQRKGSTDIVIAYRGTEFDREPVHDGLVDAGMVLTGVNAQAPDSIAFTKEVMAKAQHDAELNDRTANVTVTGHSLGGTLAEINAAKFGLKGETFNAYGAASLFGIPEGGNQVIDHVRSGDVVSAASPHFGEVREYAAQQDIDTLTKAGYRDDSGLLSPRNPFKAIDFDAHAIDNFIPESKLLGHSIISAESQARYRAHEGMVDRYRSDVMGIREGLSAPWEVPKTIAEEVGKFGHAVADKVEAGFHAVEHAVENVAEEVKETYQHVKDDISGGLHTIGDKVSSWFHHDEAPRIDSPDHPRNAMFNQARGGVEKLDAQHGRAPDTQSAQLAGSLTASAVEKGMTRIDHVALNSDASKAYAVQGDLNSPFKQVAEVNTQQALATPLEKSSETIQQHAAQHAQSQAQQSQQIAEQQAQQRQGPAPSGP